MFSHQKRFPSLWSRQMANELQATANELIQALAALGLSQERNPENSPITSELEARAIGLRESFQRSATTSLAS
jgi:hypothetical protein